MKGPQILLWVFTFDWIRNAQDCVSCIGVAPLFLILNSEVSLFYQLFFLKLIRGLNDPSWRSR